MLYKESLWIGEKVSHFAPKGSTVLNIGSSTEHFRKVDQWYIHKNIFAKIEKEDCKVIHVDIKEDKGVDEVGDVTDPAFMEKLRRFGASCLVCSNILEHLQERKNFCQGLVSIMPKGSRLIITVPYRYPFHPDPIDTLYRPTPTQLKEEFSGLQFEFGEIVECGTLLDSFLLNLPAHIQLKRKFLCALKSLLFTLGLKKYQSSHYKMQKISATCVVFKN